MFANLPKPVQAVVDSYDSVSGCYRRADGFLDNCYTELEVLAIWYHLARCTKPRLIVETGVYYGLSTSILAAAIFATGVDGHVYCIDPLNVPHLWTGTELESLITWVEKPTQLAVTDLPNERIDLLVIDSIHTYAQAAWELQALEPRVRPGGYIVMHDSLFHDGVGRAVQHLMDSPRFEVITTETPRRVRSPEIEGPVSMGMTMARKIRDGAPIVLESPWLGIPEHEPWGPHPIIRQHALLRSGV